MVRTIEGVVDVALVGCVAVVVIRCGLLVVCLLFIATVVARQAQLPPFCTRKEFKSELQMAKGLHRNNNTVAHRPEKKP